MTCLGGKSFYDIDKSVKLRFLAKFGPDHKKINEAKKKKDILKLIKYGFLAIKCLWYKKFKLKRVIKNIDTDVIFSTRIEFAKLITRKDTLNISQEHSYITTAKYIDNVKKSFNSIRYIIVMTNKAKENYESWLKSSTNRYSEVVCIPNMIEDPGSLITNLNLKQIVSIGRLEEEKDFDTLIEVFNLVHDEFKEVKLKIIGDGRKRQELEEKSKLLGLDDSIIFTGRLDNKNIKEELLNSSICVSTSINESFSLVLVEALSLGVPCISFNIDVGPKEIIENGKNGFLIEDRNIIKMKEKISFLLSSYDELRKISGYAKKSSEKYFASYVIGKWEDILEKEV